MHRIIFFLLVNLLGVIVNNSLANTGYLQFSAEEETNIVVKEINKLSSQERKKLATKAAKSLLELEKNFLKASTDAEKDALAKDLNHWMKKFIKERECLLRQGAGFRQSIFSDEENKIYQKFLANGLNFSNKLETSFYLLEIQLENGGSLNGKLRPFFDEKDIKKIEKEVIAKLKNKQLLNIEEINLGFSKTTPLLIPICNPKSSIGKIITYSSYIKFYENLTGLKYCGSAYPNKYKFICPQNGKIIIVFYHFINSKEIPTIISYFL